MNYDLDMPPYVDDMADWLDDDSKVHPCNGESAYKGFEITMGILRSVVQRGQVALPLGPGRAGAGGAEEGAAGSPGAAVVGGEPEGIREVTSYGWPGRRPSPFPLPAADSGARSNGGRGAGAAV